ncbi:MAG: response regulator [Anaerolineaceae bacterium]|nr:response regulator [Anaerolineaceae bacterium]
MNKILLVEDTVELANVIIRELEAIGYEVIHCVSGNEALIQHEKHQPILVILDWMLPGLDGLEVLRRLRTSVATPVLMLTARDEETDRVLGLELGADDYLTKPFSMRELLARIRALLRRETLIRQTLKADQQPEQTAIHKGDVFLDSTAYIAKVSGRTLELTPTEFSLLHLLMRNPGRTFNRDYLLDAVWGQSYVDGDRAVDNAILRLRKKIGKAGDSIETVWGIGYRWTDPA